MRRVVVLLGSSSDFLSGCTASLHAEIITVKKRATANRNCWQRSPNVSTSCKELLRSLLGSYEGGDSR